MNIASEGAYHRLLCYAWRADDGMLPNDEAQLKELAKWTEGDFGVVLRAFEPCPRKPTRLRNPRLYQEWLKTKARRATKVKAASIRWAKKPTAAKKPAQPLLTKAQLIEQCQQNPLYATLNLPQEVSKAERWLAAHPGRQFTKRFFVGWLNRADRPLANGNAALTQRCTQCIPPRDIPNAEWTTHQFARHPKLEA